MLSTAEQKPDGPMDMKLTAGDDDRVCSANFDSFTIVDLIREKTKMLAGNGPLCV